MGRFRKVCGRLKWYGCMGTAAYGIAAVLHCFCTEQPNGLTVFEGSFEII